MGYKCKVCKINEVDFDGDICELCAIGNDPYASALSGDQITSSYVDTNNIIVTSKVNTKATGKSRKVLIGTSSELSNTNPYGNDMTVKESSDNGVKVHKPGQAIPPSSPIASATYTPTDTSTNKTSKSIISGIVKNITTDIDTRSFIWKWVRSIFSGCPFSIDNDITMFQIFPDFSGVSLNTMGNACDQVILYGKVNAGAVSENNDVELFGYRDTKNNIIALKIKNKASGTFIQPIRTFSAGIIKIISLLLAAILVCTIQYLGVRGIIWVIVGILCLINLPLVMRIIGRIISMIFSSLRGLFRK